MGSGVPVVEGVEWAGVDAPLAGSDTSGVEGDDPELVGVIDIASPGTVDVTDDDSSSLRAAPEHPVSTHAA